VAVNFSKVSNLKSLYITNNYPANLFDKILHKFLHSFSMQSQQDDDNTDKCYVKVQYVGAAYKVFVKRLSQLVDQEFDLNLCAVFVMDKVSRYFQLKSGTCLCDTNLAYIGMTTRDI